MTKRKQTKAEAGRKGAAARNARMTPKQRSEAARKAALALWAKIRKGDLGQ